MIDRTHLRWFRPALTSCALGLVVALGHSTSAPATIVERLDITRSDTAFVDLCGLTVRIDSTSTLSGRIRAGTNNHATAFFLQYTSRSLDVFTNPSNDKFFTITGSGVYNEVKATRVAGSVFEFATVQAGQPFVVRDMNGTVVLRDRGSISTRLLFDTGGDSVPGGNEIAVLDVRVDGPHPSATLDDATSCAGVHEMIG